jgi:hypothetical protein
MEITPRLEPITKDSLSDQPLTGKMSHPKHSKTIFLQQAGALRDDPSLSELKDKIYRIRGRSEIDNDVSS